MPNWTLERTATDAFRVKWQEAKAGFEAWALLTSDHHFDNAHCDLGLLRNHMETAVELDAPIFAIGDTFCAMQGKWDKRADTSELRPEFMGGNYLDRLVDEAEKFYSPFASHLAIMSNGNHEDSIMARHQTDLTERLVGGLRKGGGNTIRGGYMGFVNFSFAMQKPSNGEKAKSHNYTMHYHHGYGGGGEVTRGLIDNSRTRSQYMADIYFSGHIHRRNADDNVIVSLDSRNGVITQKSQLFLRGGSYKDDYQGNWQRSRGQSARPMGGWWLRFRLRRNGNGSHVQLDHIPATWGRP
jgi:hypothetical protein